MDPSYETVVDPSTIVWTMTAMVLHGVMMALQVGLILFLLVSGAVTLLAPDLEGRWLSRRGARADPSSPRA